MDLKGMASKRVAAVSEPDSGKHASIIVRLGDLRFIERVLTGGHLPSQELCPLLLK